MLHMVGRVVKERKKTNKDSKRLKQRNIVNDNNYNKRIKHDSKTVMRTETDCQARRARLAHTT